MTAKDKKNSFESILNDKTSGSSGLLADLNEHFLEIIGDKKTLREEIKIAGERLHNFAAITNYLEKLASLLDHGEKDIAEFLESFASKEIESIRNIYSAFMKRVKQKDKILTISNSRTLVQIFELLGGEFPDIEIFVCESSPGNEGVLMAKVLTRAGLKVKIIPDVEAENLLPGIDAFISGADKIFPGGNITNKIGTGKIARACRKYGIPYYVLASRDKFIGRKANRGETRSKEPHIFEEIEGDFITEIVTD